MPIKNFAPETAVGTGAQTPLVDPLVQAQAVPSIKKTGLTAAGANGQNKPRVNEDQINVSGAELAEPTDDRNSTGEEEEVRSNPNAHARDADVNKVASTTRPTSPQSKRANQRPANAPQREGLPK